MTLIHVTYVPQTTNHIGFSLLSAFRSTQNIFDSRIRSYGISIFNNNLDEVLFYEVFSKYLLQNVVKNDVAYKTYRLYFGDISRLHNKRLISNKHNKD